MKDDELPIRPQLSCAVFQALQEEEIQSKIALHYREAEREMIWGKGAAAVCGFSFRLAQILGGKRTTTAQAAPHDCIAIMSYYAVCKPVTSFREIEEMEENLILPTFRKLKFVDCNKPFWRKLMYKALFGQKRLRQMARITRCRLRLMKPTSLFIMNLRRARQRSLLSGTVLRILCPPCAMWTLRPWSCSMQGWCGRPPAWTAADATTPSAAIKTRT